MITFTAVACSEESKQKDVSSSTDIKTTKHPNIANFNRGVLYSFPSYNLNHQYEGAIDLREYDLSSIDVISISVGWDKSQKGYEGVEKSVNNTKNRVYLLYLHH